MIIDIREIKTYYINLDQEVDRRKKMEELLIKHNFKNYERIDAILKENRRGCTLSHIKSLKTALKDSNYPFLILEDDVSIFNEDFIVNVPDDADAMYLGLSDIGSNLLKEEKAEDYLYIKNLNKENHQVVNMVARHAVVHLNKEYDQEALKYNKMFIKSPKKFVGGDVAISQLNKNKKVYALNTPIFYQNDPKIVDHTKLTINETKFEVIS